MGTCARAKEGQKVTHGNFEIDCRGDLTVVKTRHAQLVKETTRIPRVQQEMEQQQRGTTGNGTQKATRNEQNRQVPSRRVD